MRRGPVVAHAEESVQVDAVVGVLVSDGDGVDGAVGPVGKQPRQGGVAEVEHQAVAVPVDGETAAGAARFGKGAATAEHGELAHGAGRPGAGLTGVWRG